MSTKLYDGLRLIDPSREIFELVPLLAPAIRGAFLELAEKLVAEELVHYLDGMAGEVIEDPELPVVDAVERNWKARQQSFGAHHTLNDPLRFSMVFGRSSRGSILAYPFYREPLYRQVLDGLELFEDYHYQNQSDQPEGISEEEWGARGTEWNSLTNSEGTFGDLPGWELSGSMDPFTEILLSSRSRSFDANGHIDADRRLRDILAQELVARGSKELSIPRDRIMGFVYEAQRAVSSFLRDGHRAAAVARPAPLPRGLSFSYLDLPDPYEVDGALLDELLGDLREGLRARS